LLKKILGNPIGEQSWRQSELKVQYVALRGRENHEDPRENTTSPFMETEFDLVRQRQSEDPHPAIA
jgi:hypothetical protein